MWRGLVKKALVSAGAPRFIRAQKGWRLRILMYHRFQRVASERTLARQLAHIQRHYSPVSLTEACSAIMNGSRLKPDALAITVDDGYADFEQAWPVFQRYNLPVTLFVVSRFAAGEIWLWPDVALWCLRNSQLQTVAIPLGDGATFEHSLSSAAERALAAERLNAALIAAPDHVRRSVIGALPELLQVKPPGVPPPEFAALDWKALRKMSESGLHVGAHTRTHPLLSRLDGPAALREEVAGSKIDIERAIDAPAEHFCYPNGTAADYDEASCREARDAGFLSAVTAVRGLNAPGAKRYEFRRVGVEPGMPLDAFALEIAGFRMP